MEDEGQDDTETGIWADHVEALHAFFHVSTQFRVVCPGDGRVLRTGLDYTAARAGLDLAGVTVTPELWFDIQVIEAGVIEAGHEVQRSWL